MLTRPILTDKSGNASLLRDGYIVVSNFLSAEEIQGLRLAYDSYDPGISSRYYSTIDSWDRGYKHHVNLAIRQAAMRSVAQVFNHYRPLTGNFVIKRKGRKSKVYMHFDISCVDERQHESCVLWLPLMDVDLENGALQMMAGSHRFMNPIRGPGVRRYYESLYGEFERNWMTPVPMKAGDALIFLNRILHYSPPNRSRLPRIGARIDMIPTEAQAIMYHWQKGTPQDFVEVYAIDDDFYEYFRKEKAPVGAHLLRLEENRFEELAPKQLLNQLLAGNLISA